MAGVPEGGGTDIGDFADGPIIGGLVSEGDSVAPEAPLVTLESDKATMDVPAPFAGTVAELLVEVGDTVSEGSTILKIEISGGNGATPADDEDDEGGDDEPASGENGGAEEG